MISSLVGRLFKAEGSQHSINAFCMSSSCRYRALTVCTRYPDRAVLEGVVNALIHRNYLEIGSEVHIDMFDDRIEIYSPGGMVSGISLEGKNLLKIPSK